jgi:LysM repeat protein
VFFFTVYTVLAYTNYRFGGEINMKNLSYFLAALFFVLFASACRSAPVPEDGGAAQTEVTAASGEDSADNEEADRTLLLGIYNGYQGIVLDGAKEYTVKRGDTLSQIAKANYGQDNGYYFPLIMFASKVVVADPDKIKPEQKLTIPNLQNNLNDKFARSHLKSLLLDIAFIYDYKSDHSRGALKARNERDRDGLVALSRSL